MRQMIKAIYEEWDTNSLKSFSKGHDRYNLNRLYAIGKNSADKYKPMFEVSDDQNSSFINLDLSPPAILPKFKRIINNKHSKIDFRINAQAIDPYALDDKLEYEATEQANIKVRSMLDELGIPSDVLDTGEVDQPKDEEELAIKMEFGYKHNMAIDIEKRVDAVFTAGRIKESLTVVRDRLFDSGVAIVKSITKPDTGEVTFRTVAPENWIVSPTEDPFFRDIWYAGEAILMTIDEIRRECEASGVNITEQMLEEIAGKHIGKWGNAKSFGTGALGSYAYDSTKIPVFDGEFLSSNKQWYEKRWDKRGNPVVGKVDKKGTKSDREYYADEDVVVFRFKWIIDTEIIFNYGLKSDVVRKNSCLWDTKLSYIAAAPELNKMETNPMIEQMIPVVDQIIIAWYKLQNVIAKARPSGIAIEIGALEDISMGDGGMKDMTPLSILDMFTQTGVLAYRKIGADGTPSNQKPIEELKNGLGTEASDYFSVIERYMNWISGIIGMNDVTDGSTPDPKTLNGVAALSTEATSNALHHLLLAERYLIEMLADDVAVRVHDSMVLKKNSPYRNIVGASNIKSAKEDIGALHREYGMAVEYDADDVEKQELNMSIMQAEKNLQINIADRIAIKNVRNIKQAELLLAYRIRKNEEKAADAKQQEQLTNAEASAMAAKAAEEEKRLTIKLETESKIAIENVKGQWRIKERELELQLKGVAVADTNQAKKEVEEIRVDGANQKEIIKNQKASTSKIA